jgi:hypothetical protein
MTKVHATFLLGNDAVIAERNHGTHPAESSTTDLVAGGCRSACAIDR